MLRRFFIWRGLRRMNRPRYRMDRRRYHGRFTAGFLGYLGRAGFWQEERDLFTRRKNRRRMLLGLFLCVATLFAGWVIWESVQALALFRS